MNACRPALRAVQPCVQVVTLRPRPQGKPHSSGVPVRKRAGTLRSGVTLNSAPVSRLVYGGSRRHRVALPAGTWLLRPAPQARPCMAACALSLRLLGSVPRVVQHAACFGHIPTDTAQCAPGCPRFGNPRPSPRRRRSSGSTYRTASCTLAGLGVVSTAIVSTANKSFKPMPLRGTA